MPILARKTVTEKPNFVSPPTLPVPITKGAVSWSKSLESSQLSASISYEEVALPEISRLEAAYTPGLVENNPVKINLFGISFQVASFQYDRTKYILKGVEHFDRYKVSVSLEWEYEKLISAPIKVFRIVPLGSAYISVTRLAAAAKVPYTGIGFNIPIPKNSDKDFTLTLADVVTKKARVLGCFVVYGSPGIELRKIDGVRSWSFPENDVISDGGNTIKGAIAYNKAEMTFSSDEDTDKEEDKDSPPGVRLVKKDPVIEVTRDLDSDSPSSPPANSDVLKSIDSNSVDGQGPKLTATTTTTQDGQTMRVERQIYGFLYTAKDIHVGDGILLGNPVRYWTMIEFQSEEHIYQALPDLTLSVSAKDPAPKYAQTALSGNVTLIINPDYDQFVSALGGGATFKSTAKYLVQIKTTGWAYRRLIKETDALETIDSDETDPKYPYYFFKKIPVEGETNYYLTSADQKYGDNGASMPFSVEWKSVAELTETEKKRVGNSSVTAEGKVGVLTPDINYVQPMQQIFEGTCKNSFAWAPNPEFDSEDPATYNPLVTGEESYETTWRTIVDANHYRERQTSFSASNSDYANCAETVKVKYAVGKPPEGTSLKEAWETAENKATDAAKKDEGKASKKYYVTTDLLGRTPEGGSVSGTSDAKNLTEAKLALLTDLRIQGWQQGNQESKTISWFYDKIEPGDIVVVPSRRFQKYGGLRVTGASWDLKYDGYGNNIFKPQWITTDGTKLTLGCDRIRNITVDVVEVPGQGSNNGTNSGDPKLSVTAGGESKNLGIPYVSGPNRRRF